MNIKDALLAVIGSGEDGINGRTILQKKMYFLAVLTGEEFGFGPHYYGPYSSTVADQLGALCEALLVSEQVKVDEIRRFSYRLTDEGREVADMRSDAVGIYNKAIEKINSHPMVNDPNLLYKAAKVHFIVNEHGRTTVPKIRQRAEELGWNVLPSEVDTVVEYLEHLDLVETS